MPTARSTHRMDDALQCEFDVGLGIEPSNADPHGSARLLASDSHRGQHMRWRRLPGAAGGPLGQGYVRQ